MERTLPHVKLLTQQGIAMKAAAERRRLIRKAVVLLVFVLVSALFCVWSRVKIIQLGYEISALKSQEEELSKKESHLELEVEALRSPKRLEKVAIEVLGMHPPAGDEIVFVKKTAEEQ